MILPQQSRLLDPEAVEAVLLDAGGTLIDLDYHWFVQQLAALGVETGERALVEAEAAARAWADTEVRQGSDPRDLWHGYFDRMLATVGLDGSHRSVFIDDLRERNRGAGLWRTPVHRAYGVLETLRGRGYRLAVVSNAEGRVEADLQAAGFGSQLEFVLDSHLVGVAKPDPGIFHLALDRLGLPSDAALHVGDVYAIDVVGARTAGLVPVLLDTTDTYPDADCLRIRCLADLLDHLPGA